MYWRRRLEVVYIIVNESQPKTGSEKGCQRYGEPINGSNLCKDTDGDTKHGVSDRKVAGHCTDDLFYIYNILQESDLLIL